MEFASSIDTNNFEIQLPTISISIYVPRAAKIRFQSRAQYLLCLLCQVWSVRAGNIKLKLHTICVRRRTRTYVYVPAGRIKR